ncbi:putative GTPase [Beggiatoa alba B18LD]|uniref:Putative GTPase n=1 Tax=Beggiatoa alba B18LD TaxID=395493 RepID=I3CEZ2_9GAMM|nr:ATP/GTP-binding protein [Beggiatoa alba]EIJ42185.1 putative GTPase [Beggiatoa alba B18LD]
MEKIIFTGPMGAGKTTAISSISEVPPISTDVRCSDNEGQARKETTTVAMDYGYFTLDDGQRVHLYGTPGQQRFDYMWTILAQGGIGLVLLLDNARPDPLADLEFYLDSFKDFINQTGAVIGITRMDVSNHVSLDDYRNKLMSRNQIFPLFEIDARQANDVKILVHALLAILQAQM